MNGRESTAQERTFHTIGYEGRSLQEFIDELISAGVKRLLDVRYNPISRKAGFSKTAMKEALAPYGIEYVHIRTLGIPSEYRAGLGNADSYQDLFALYENSLLPQAEREVWLASSLISETTTALMCFELDHKMCHRHVLAEELTRKTQMRANHL